MLAAPIADDDECADADDGVYVGRSLQSCAVAC